MSAGTPETVTVTLPAPVLALMHLAGSDPDDSDGMWPAEYCGPDGPWATDEEHTGPGCGKEIEDGQPVRKLGGWWMHADCAHDAITTADVDGAWLLLADQVASRPHRFRSSEIRVVLRSVAVIAERRAAQLERTHSALRHESDAHAAERGRLRAALARTSGGAS